VWRRREQPLDAETVNGIIEALVRIDAKLDEVLLQLRGEDDGEAHA
jgi:hypothetical protein